MGENPYSPPDSAADLPASKASPTTAGPIVRMLATLMVVFVVPMSVVFALTANSLYDAVTLAFVALMALGFARIISTGWLYPKNRNS